MSHEHSASVFPRLKSDSGFMLIEVMVSAAILVLVSLGAFMALQAADEMAANQQRRSVAANLAQAELERVRSLPLDDVDELVAGASGRSVLVRNGIDYTVDTSSNWSDETGVSDPSCTPGTLGSAPRYLKVTTSVSWPGMKQAKAPRVTQLLSPSISTVSAARGSLAVQINDRRGEGYGIPNVPVTITGPVTLSAVTDANGCVVWDRLSAASAWKVSFSKAGFVTPDGTTSVNEDVTLTNGSRTVKTYLYDVGGMISSVRFRSRVDATTTIDAPQRGLVLFHSGAGTPRRVPVADATTWNGSGTLLFPFESDYSLYAGTCAAASPVAPATATLVRVYPGQTVPGVTDVYVPAVRVTVRSRTWDSGFFGLGAKWNAYTTPTAAPVKVTDSCGQGYTRATVGSTGVYVGGFPYSAGVTAQVCASSGAYNESKAVGLISQAAATGVAVDISAGTGTNRSDSGACS